MPHAKATQDNAAFSILVDAQIGERQPIPPVRKEVRRAQLGQENDGSYKLIEKPPISGIQDAESHRPSRFIKLKGELEDESTLLRYYKGDPEISHRLTDDQMYEVLLAWAERTRPSAQECVVASRLLTTSLCARAGVTMDGRLSPMAVAYGEVV
jgi:hypothetical protein